MFDNIGGKLKTLAKTACWIGVIASVISAIVIWSGSSYRNDQTVTGLIVLIAGSLGSWIGSWTLYAFGQITEDVHAMREAGDGATRMPTYQQARARMAEGDYEAALALLEGISTYRDASALQQECCFHLGEAYFINGKYMQAANMLKQAGKYPGAEDMHTEAVYQRARTLLEQGRKGLAFRVLQDILDYKDVRQIINDDPDLAQLYSKAEDLAD